MREGRLYWQGCWTASDWRGGEGVLRELTCLAGGGCTSEDMLLRSDPMDSESAPPAALLGSPSSRDSITEGVKLNSREPRSGSAADSVTAALTGEGEQSVTRSVSEPASGSAADSVTAALTGEVRVVSHTVSL